MPDAQHGIAFLPYPSSAKQDERLAVPGRCVNGGMLTDVLCLREKSNRAILSCVIITRYTTMNVADCAITFDTPEALCYTPRINEANAVTMNEI